MCYKISNFHLFLIILSNSSKSFKPSKPQEKIVSKNKMAAIQYYLLDQATGDGHDTFTILDDFPVTAFPVM